MSKSVLATASFLVLAMTAVVASVGMMSKPVMATEFAAGSEIPMVSVSSSYPGGYKGQLLAVVGDNGTDLTSFKFSDSRGTNNVYSLEQLRKGIVIVHEIGKDILKIKAPGFDPAAGGGFTLTFLKNFFGSDRRDVHFEYVRNATTATGWILQTNDSQGRDPFDSIAVIVYKKLGIPSGVGKITLSYSKAIVREYDPNKLPTGRLRLRGIGSRPRTF